MVDALLLRAPDNRSAPVAPDGKYSFSGLTAGTWRIVVESGDRHAIGGVVIRTGVAATLDLQLIQTVPLTLRLHPAPAGTEYLQLLSGDLTGAQTGDELAVAVGGMTLLTTSGDGEWSTATAPPGAATLFIRDRAVDALRVSLTLIHVPPAGGTVDATPAVPRVLRYGAPR